MMNSKEDQLQSLWSEVDDLHRQHYPDHPLMPIVGNGQIDRPKFMFVFINPTARNSSSDPSWPGSRFPFVGTKPIWRIFTRAGLFAPELLAEIEQTTSWPVALSNRVLDELKRRSFYFTNLVKWTGPNGGLPDKLKIDLFGPILNKEIAIVEPTSIVTFGIMPFQWLAKRPIKLNDYYLKVMEARRLFPMPLNFYHTGRIIPCYFPIGRGNPRRAIELLGLLSQLP